MKRRIVQLAGEEFGKSGLDPLNFSIAGAKEAGLIDSMDAAVETKRAAISEARGSEASELDALRELFPKRSTKREVQTAQVKGEEGTIDVEASVEQGKAHVELRAKENGRQSAAKPRSEVPVKEGTKIVDAPKDVPSHIVGQAGEGELGGMAKKAGVSEKSLREYINGEFDEGVMEKIFGDPEVAEFASRMIEAKEHFQEGEADDVAGDRRMDTGPDFGRNRKGFVRIRPGGLTEGQFGKVRRRMDAARAIAQVLQKEGALWFPTPPSLHRRLEQRFKGANNYRGANGKVTAKAKAWILANTTAAKSFGQRHKAIIRAVPGLRLMSNSIDQFREFVGLGVWGEPPSVTKGKGVSMRAIWVQRERVFRVVEDMRSKFSYQTRENMWKLADLRNDLIRLEKTEAPKGDDAKAELAEKITKRREQVEEIRDAIREGAPKTRLLRKPLIEGDEFLTEVERYIDQVYQPLTETFFKDLQRLYGDDLDKQALYVRRLYKGNPEAIRVIIDRFLSPLPATGKKRRYPTHIEAQEAIDERLPGAGRLRFSTIDDALLSATNVLAKSMMFDRFVGDVSVLRASDGLPMVRKAKKKVKDAEREPYLNVAAKNFSIDGKVISNSMRETLERVLGKGTEVHEDYFKWVVRMKDKAPVGPVALMWQRLQYASKRIRLIASLFHRTAIWESSVAGRPIRQGVVNPARSLIPKGIDKDRPPPHYLERLALKPDSLELRRRGDPMNFDDPIEMAVGNGMNLGVADFEEIGFKNWLQRHAASPNLAAAISAKAVSIPMAVPFYFDTLLWERAYVNAKANIYLSTAERIANSPVGAAMNPREIASTAAKLTNNFVGGQSKDVHPAMRTWMRNAMSTFIFAPDWTYSNMANVMNAIGVSDIASQVLKKEVDPTGLKTKFSREYTARMGLGLYVFGNAMNYLATLGDDDGPKFMFQNPEGRGMDIRLPQSIADAYNAWEGLPPGTKHFISNGKQLKEVGRLFSDPVAYFGGKAGPVLQAVPAAFEEFNRARMEDVGEFKQGEQFDALMRAGWAALKEGFQPFAFSGRSFFAILPRKVALSKTAHQRGLEERMQWIYKHPKQTSGIEKRIREMARSNKVALDNGVLMPEIKARWTRSRAAVASVLYTQYKEELKKAVQDQPISKRLETMALNLTTGEWIMSQIGRVKKDFKDPKSETREIFEALEEKRKDLARLLGVDHDGLEKSVQKAIAEEGLFFQEQRRIPE